MYAIVTKNDAGTLGRAPIFTPRSVVFPPSPIGPMPNSFAYRKSRFSKPSKLPKPSKPRSSNGLSSCSFATS